VGSALLALYVQLQSTRRSVRSAGWLVACAYACRPPDGILASVLFGSRRSRVDEGRCREREMSSWREGRDGSAWTSDASRAPAGCSSPAEHGDFAHRGAMNQAPVPHGPERRARVSDGGLGRGMKALGLFRVHYLAKNLGVMGRSAGACATPRSRSAVAQFKVNEHAARLWLVRRYLWLFWPKRRAALRHRGDSRGTRLAMMDLLYQNSGWRQFRYASRTTTKRCFVILALGGSIHGAWALPTAEAGEWVELFGARFNLRQAKTSIASTFETASRLIL